MNTSLERGTFLTPPQAARTDEYLRGVAAAHPTAPVRLQSLFGRCCLAVVTDSQGPNGVDAARVWSDWTDYASSLLRDPDADQLGLDPLLLVEAAWVLQRAGHPIPALQPLTARVAAELANQPENVASLGRIRLLAGRLRDLGYLVTAVAPHRAAAVLRKNVSSWLSTPLAELGDLIDHLMAEGDPLDAIQSEALSLIALAELRNYRVDVGCKILRLVLQHGEVREEATEALNYVAVQRRRNGSYGFTSPFQEQNANVVPGDLTLHLPMTLNAAWLFYATTGDVARQPAVAKDER